MSPPSLFLVEVGISLFSSTLVVAFLTGPLRRLLVEACGSIEHTSFWVAYSDAMIFIAPLVTTVVFGKSGDLQTPTLPFYKAALGASLFGVFVALAAVGLQVARILPRQPPEVSAPASPVARAAVDSPSTEEHPPRG